MAAATFTAKDLATECNTDGRTIRKFLRGHLPAEDQPGQGGRYAFTKKEMTALKKAFEASTKRPSTEEDAPKAKSTKKKSKKAPVPDFEVGGNGDREPDEDSIDEVLAEVDDPSLDDIEELEFEIDDLDDLDD